MKAVKVGTNVLKMNSKMSLYEEMIKQAPWAYLLWLGAELCTIWKWFRVVFLLSWCLMIFCLFVFIPQVTEKCPCLCPSRRKRPNSTKARRRVSNPFWTVGSLLASSSSSLSSSSSHSTNPVGGSSSFLAGHPLGLSPPTSVEKSWLSLGCFFCFLHAVCTSVWFSWFVSDHRSSVNTEAITAPFRWTVSAAFVM